MPNSNGPADTVIVRARVTTGREGEPDAGALAVRADRIVAVGTEEQIRGYIGAGTEVLDVAGRRVVPGLIDSHIHMVRAGLTWHTEARWDGLPTLAAGLEAISAAADRRGAGEWVRVLGGWAPGQFREGRGPTRAELDAAAPHNPVYVQLLYEDAVLNSQALARTGLDDPDTVPDGAVVERDPATGLPTGRVRGKPALDLCTRTVGRPDLGQQIANVESLLREFAGYGLTGVADPNGFGVTPDSYRALFAVWRAGGLTTRTRLYLGPSGPGTELEDYRNWARFTHPGFGDPLLSILGFGEACSYGCMDLEGLDPDYRASEQGRKDVAAVSRLAVEFGWPVHVHAILDESISAVLDEWEAIDRETPLAGLRFSLCHADAIGARNLERVAALGVALAVQNRLVYRAADSARAWGEHVAGSAPPLRDILDAGIPVGAGTDSTVVSSPNPWLSLWWLVTGRTLDGSAARDPRQCVTRAEALRMYTAGSAWLSFEEAERGSLEVGKLADLAVLSEDLFSVADDAIPQIRSVLTMVGGRVVHDNRSPG